MAEQDYTKTGIPDNLLDSFRRFLLAGHSAAKANRLAAEETGLAPMGKSTAKKYRKRVLNNEKASQDEIEEWRQNRKELFIKQAWKRIEEIDQFITEDKLKKASLQQLITAQAILYDKQSHAAGDVRDRGKAPSLEGFDEIIIQAKRRNQAPRAAEDISGSEESGSLREVSLPRSHQRRQPDVSPGDDQPGGD